MFDFVFFNLSMVWLYVLNMHGYLIYMYWNWYVWYELWHGIVGWWCDNMLIGSLR